MTISSTTNRNDYTGNASTGTYAYGFKIFSNTDLLVTVRDTDGVESSLTLTTHFTVTGVGTSSGGNIVLVNGAFNWVNGSGYLKTGYHLTVRRVRPIKQTTDIRNQGPFYPAVHEDAFDHFVMIDQQQQNDIAGSIRLPETLSSSDFDTTLPSDIADNPGASFIVNDAGDGLDLGPTSDAIAGAQTAATSAASSATTAATSATAAAASAASAAAALASVTSFWCGTAGGTGNAFTLTPTPVIASYTAGQQFRFIAVANNTTAATVAVSGLSAKDVRTQSGTALTSGEIVSGKIYSITYDGTLFIVHELSTPEDGAVTAAKIATNAVTTAKVGAGQITYAKLAADVLSTILPLIFPIGSIYSNGSVTTNPNTLFGFGTWVAFGAEKTTVGYSAGGDADFDSLADTGGAKTVTLSKANLPPHVHTYLKAISAGNFDGSSSPLFNSNTAEDTGNGSGDGLNATPFSVMNPYVVSAQWKRTA